MDNFLKKASLKKATKSIILYIYCMIEMEIFNYG